MAMVGSALPSFRFYPLVSLLFAIALQLTPSARARARARRCVFHCCEHMQIAIAVPGLSINSNRINSSAVIVFCTSQKTLYTRGQHRVLPRYEQCPVHTNDCASPFSHCVPIVVKSRLKIEPNGPRGFDITSAIDHFIGNYLQRFVSDVSVKTRIE